ncbi:MAG TPA: TetR/AcrR family transcriptional regulator [Aestuariivirga sp.]|nr:TetR/AcrR family transcriptional regulator [Aestuariivirga sp.]
MATPAKKPRNPDDTKRRILAAAKVEFAKKGLGGARVDDIAARAKANKRMMYHYFGNKDDLFKQVVEEAYGEFREREAALELDSLDPVAAIKALIAFIWKYFLDNPEFITLVNSENLHKARHIRKSRRMEKMNRSFVGRTQHLLERGVKAQVFRKGLDPVQVNISIAAVGYYYLTNRFTGSVVFERDLMSEEALAARLEFNTQTILRMICTPQTLERIDA